MPAVEPSWFKDPYAVVFALRVSDRVLHPHLRIGHSKQGFITRHLQRLPRTQKRNIRRPLYLEPTIGNSRKINLSASIDSFNVDPPAVPSLQRIRSDQVFQFIVRAVAIGIFPGS